MTKKEEELLELDLEELTTPVKTTHLATSAVEKAVDFLTRKKPKVSEEDEWKACLTRMSEHTKRDWLCIPRIQEDSLYLTVEELNTVDGKTFMEWVKLVYPLAESAGFEADKCSDYTYRETAYLSILRNSRWFKIPAAKVSNTKK